MKLTIHTTYIMRASTKLEIDKKIGGAITSR